MHVPGPPSGGTQPVSPAPEQALDALARAVIMTNPAGIVTLWNQAAERIFGWSEDEALGRSVVDLLAPPELADGGRTMLATVAAGRPVSGDRLVRHRDGHLITIASSTAPVFDDHGHVIAVVGVSEDVTAVRAAARATRDLTEQFQAALEAGGLGTWRRDIATGRSIWDERLEALFGLPPGGFDGRFETFASLVHPDDRAMVLRSMAQAVEDRTPYRIDHRVVWPDGSVHWISGAASVLVDDHGAVTGMVGCATDITERVSQEEALQHLAELARGAAERERVQRARVEFLAAISDGLRESESVSEIMQRVTAQAVPRLGDWCVLYVLPFDGGTTPNVALAHANPALAGRARDLIAGLGFDRSAPTGPAAVIRTGRPEFARDLSDRAAAGNNLPEGVRQVVRELGMRSSITVPLVKRGRVLGAMQLVASITGREYTDDDVILTQTVADRIASSLENRRLLEQQQFIARTLQQSLLPTALPEIPGLEIAARYWAAGEGVDVGGDFYDVFALKQDDVWGVVIGDVCGTGPAAAALTGLARHSIRASAWHGESPAEILTSLNYAVHSAATASFLTVVFAELHTDRPDPVLRVARGGHPPPILVTGKAAEPVNPRGALIGVLDDLGIVEATATLGPGDLIAFYTDGATDVAPPYMLDTQQMTEIVARAARATTTAAAAADHIQQALDAVLPLARRNDDIALLILRRSDAAG